MYTIELSFTYNQQDNLSPLVITFDNGFTLQCPLTGWIRIGTGKLPASITVEGNATGVKGRYKRDGQNVWDQLSAPITVKPPQGTLSTPTLNTGAISTAPLK